MQPKVVTNTFQKLKNNSIPELSAPTTYEMALNAVKKSAEGEGFGLVNEGSTYNKEILPDIICGGVIVEGRNWLLVLLKTGELGYFDMKSEKYTRIYDLNNLNKNSKDACSGKDVIKECKFNFSGCEWINIDYNYWNTCNELHIIFSHDCTYYTVNVDELMDEDRAAKVTCSDIRTFDCVCVPTVRPVNVEGGGGAGLKNGKYRFAIRLFNKDGHKTNFFNISREVFVGGDKNIPGEISNEYITIWITGLSCQHSAIQLAVIKHIGDGASAQILDRIDFAGSTYTHEYRGDTGKEIDIPLEEITTRKVGYLQGRGVKVFDGRAMYFQLKNERNFQIQKVANRAVVGLDLYKIPSHLAHNYPGLQPGERYILGLAGQYCDATETAVGVLSDIGGELNEPLGSRSNEEDEGNGSGGPGEGGGKNPNEPGGTGTGTAGPPPIRDGREEPGGVRGNKDLPIDTGEAGSSGSSGGNGSITFSNKGTDDYVNYKDLPPENKRSQEDGYYTDGCVTGDTACEPMGKAMHDAFSGIADELPEDSDEADEAGDCLECGDEEKPKGFVKAAKKLFSVLLFGPWSIGNSKNRKNKKGSRTANGLKSVLQNFLKEAEEEEVHMPVRTTVKVSNSKKAKGGPVNQLSPTGDIGEQYDNINIYKVGPLKPQWVDSTMTYPMTLDCNGGYVYGHLAGKNIRLLEIPLIPHFESNNVGSKGSKLMSVDESEGYVFVVGVSISNVVLGEGPKPWCESQPWKGVYIPRDSSNSRVTACGIAIHTFAGTANGRDYAVPKHGVNSREKIDRYIQTGGDDHVHTGEAHGANIYTFLSPDTLLGKIPLVATHFWPVGTFRGDGWRHGQYAEANKRVGFFEQKEDQRGTRQSVNLHSFDFASKNPVRILGISKAEGNKPVPAPRGVSLPLLNLGRETSVYFELAASIGQPEDRSFIADGLDHFGLVYDAEATYGYLIREIPAQYGSIVGAKYVDLGVYAKKDARSASACVGDSFCGSFSVRRTSYISNRVGNRTFIPSPRKWTGFMRFLGFGDPTEPPESGDTRDPKNKANRYPNMGLHAAALSGGAASGPNASVYYPGFLKCLVFFWAQSRVNAHYRQRGDETIGEVYAGNLGTAFLDSDTPKGSRWEECWLNRIYKEILRESRFHALIRPVIRIGAILGIPIYFIFNGFAIFGNLDFILGFWIRIAIFLIVWLLCVFWIFTPSRINRMMGLKEQLNDNEGGADDENVRQLGEDNYRKYSAEYNVGSSISSSIGMTDPFNVCVCDKCEELDYSKYKKGGIGNNIRYSARQYRNTEINAFKHVLDGDYGEMQTNTSQLQTLISLNNVLFAVTTDGWYRLSYSGNVNYRGVEYLLGNGQALGTPMRVGEGAKEGVFGCIDPNSIIVFPGGAAFPDGKANTINIFNGTSFKAISDDDVYQLMSNYMDFCVNAECRDQKNSGQWYSLGYDPELNRLLVTKRDGNGGGSWTLSYDMREGTWISAHSYTPNFYFWDRGKFFSVKDNNIWRHNDPNSKQTFYDDYAPFKVWLNSVALDQSATHALDLQAEMVELHTIANDLKEGTRNRHFTFNVGGWSNSYQFSGVHLLDTDYYKCPEYKDIRERGYVQKMKRNARGPWRINAALRDRIKNVEDPIVKSEKCSFIKDFNTANSISKGGQGAKSNMADNYLRHMYSFDDKSLSHIELKLLRVIVYGKEFEK